MAKKDCVLVIAAHPDDEVLGCGGTMAKMAKEGHAVYSLILGGGVAARYDVSTSTDKAIERLQAQSERANKSLGVRRIYRKDFPDNRFDTVALLDIIKAIEAVKEELQPTIVFTHHANDVNVDHQQTFKAVLSAFRPQPGEVLRRLLSFYVLSSTDWQVPALGSFAPTVFVNIEKTIEAKVRALQAYKDEIRPYPHPRSTEGLRIEAQRTGLRIGCRAAEAFELLREIVD